MSSNARKIRAGVETKRQNGKKQDVHANGGGHVKVVPTTVASATAVSASMVVTAAMLIVVAAVVLAAGVVAADMEAAVVATVAAAEVAVPGATTIRWRRRQV